MTTAQIVRHYQQLIFDRTPSTLKGHYILAGGCLRDLIAGHPVNDIDVFPLDEEAEIKLMRVFGTSFEHVITFPTSANYTFHNYRIQIVRGRYPVSGLPINILKTFDYNICMVGMMHWGLFTEPCFWQGMATKELQLINCPYPLKSFQRLRNFMQKGYKAEDHVLLRLAAEINAINRRVFNSDLPSEDDRPIIESTDIFYQEVEDID